MHPTSETRSKPKPLSSKVAKLAALFLLAALPAAKAETVTDTLRGPDGAAVEGRVTVRWVSFLDEDSQIVPGGDIFVDTASGVFSFTLTPNADAVTPNTFYNVTYRVLGTTSAETWVVPDSAGTLTVSDVRSSVPAPTVVIGYGQLPVGGAATNDVLKFNGSAWGPDTDATGSSSGITCGTTPTPLTVASGVLTITSSACFSVNTESSGATDDVDTIVCTAGWRFELLPIHDGRTVILKQSASILMRKAFYLDNVGDRWLGFCQGTDLVSERGRSDNGG